MGKIISLSEDTLDDAIEQSAEALLNSGVVVVPTDTVYGISALAKENNPAVQRIFEIKKRPSEQSIPWLVDDMHRALKYGINMPEYAYTLMQKCWPGALTLVMYASREVPDDLMRKKDSTIALRVPDNQFLRLLINKTGFPLVTSSANIHNNPAPTNFNMLEKEILEQSDLNINGGVLKYQAPSTIISICQKQPRVLREGALSKERIHEILGI